MMGFQYIEHQKNLKYPEHHSMISYMGKLLLGKEGKMEL
jgi:hypothetical protein